MANEPKTATGIAVKWAVFQLIVSVIFTYAFEFLDLQNSPFRYASFIPFIVFLLLTQKEVRDSQGGFITFGKGFSSGFIYAVFCALMGAIFIWLYLKVLSPEVFEKSLAQSESDMIDKHMSRSEIDKAMSIAREYGFLIGIIASIVGSIISGAIVSLIGAAIFKKDPPPFDPGDIELAKDYPAV